MQFNYMLPYAKTVAVTKIPPHSTGFIRGFLQKEFGKPTEFSED